MKLIFCLQINTKVFYKLIVSLWVCVARHAQKYPKQQLCNIFAISQGKHDGVEFLSAGKQIFLWIGTIILGVWPGIPKLSKIASLLYLCNIVRKKWVISCMQIRTKASCKFMLWFLMGMRMLEMKLSFCVQINIKVFYMVISTVWPSKFPVR